MNTYCEVNGQHVSEARTEKKLAQDISGFLAHFSANEGDGKHIARVEIWEMGNLSYKGRYLVGQSLTIDGGLVASKYRDFSKIAQRLANRAYDKASA